MGGWKIHRSAGEATPVLIRQLEQACAVEPH